MTPNERENWLLSWRLWFVGVNKSDGRSGSFVAVCARRFIWDVALWSAAGSPKQHKQIKPALNTGLCLDCEERTKLSDTPSEFRAVCVCTCVIVAFKYLKTSKTSWFYFGNNNALQVRSCVGVFLPLSGLFCVCVSFLWVVLLHLFPINLPPWGISGNAFHFGFAFTLLDDYFSLAQPPRPFFWGGRVVAFRIIFLNLRVLWNCVVCICARRWISTVCLSRLSIIHLLMQRSPKCRSIGFMDTYKPLQYFCPIMAYCL